MGEDIWAGLVDRFADEAYASVKGRVRTCVMHQKVPENLPAPPATALDVGGGADHQSFPLAEAGYRVTVLDPSPAMLACRCAADGGTVSITTVNADAMAMRPALDPGDEEQALATARVELEASRRDPYRVFHLLGRMAPADGPRAGPLSDRKVRT